MEGRKQQAEGSLKFTRYRHASSRAFAVYCLLPTAYCLLFSTGCVRQQLAIRSEPPGAELLLNDQPIGTTPCTYDFLWYGWYRVTLEKPGYERLDERVMIKSPWYLWMPLDFVMELWPLTVRDMRALSFQLQPEVPIPEPTRPVIDSQADHGKAPTPANGGT